MKPKTAPSHPNSYAHFHLLFLFLFHFLLLSSLPLKLFAQSNPEKNYMESIKKYNLSELYAVDSIFTYVNHEIRTKIHRSNVLGFAGSDYQRLHVKFIRLVKKQNNPLEYLVWVRIKYKDSIHTFKGTLQIREAKMYEYCDIPLFEWGYVVCHLKLTEKKDSSISTLEGKMKSYFLLDDRGNFRYNTIGFDMDDFSNNQFTGRWKMAGEDSSVVCNWGDYRIPACGDLDEGTSEFALNEKYVKNGWDLYYKASNSYPDSPEWDKYWGLENEAWWR